MNGHVSYEVVEHNTVIFHNHHIDSYFTFVRPQNIFGLIVCAKKIEKFRDEAR
jgi:hypothetical protein